MSSYFFWNMYRKPLEHLVVEAARERDIDVILLAECGSPPIRVLEALNSGVERKYNYHANPADQKNRILTFSRYPLESLQVIQEPLTLDNTVTFLRLRPPAEDEVLLIAAHLRSKYSTPEREQEAYIHDVVRRIEWAERTVEHQRTIIVGDLNVNPFEVAMVSVEGFHAVSSRRIAETGSRQVARRHYPFFYNPMWRHFGDSELSPPGTYYRSNSTHIEFFWHMFDQVLVRPLLLERFMDESLEIVTQIGETNLLSQLGRPDDERASDHLPITFALSLLEENDGSR